MLLKEFTKKNLKGKASIQINLSGSRSTVYVMSENKDGMSDHPIQRIHGGITWDKQFYMPQYVKDLTYEAFEELTYWRNIKVIKVILETSGNFSVLIYEHGKPARLYKMVTRSSIVRIFSLIGDSYTNYDKRTYFNPLISEMVSGIYI